MSTVNRNKPRVKARATHTTLILDAWHPQTCLGVFLLLLLSDYISKADLSLLFEKLPDDYSKKFNCVSTRSY